MKLKTFVEVPRADWKPRYANNLSRVLLNRDYLVQEYQEADGIVRLSICSTKNKGGKWVDGITWDTLQAIKDAIGYRHRVAVEIYPQAKNIVNVANMRHLWVLQEPPTFMWGRD